MTNAANSRGWGSLSVRNARWHKVPDLTAGNMPRLSQVQPELHPSAMDRQMGTGIGTEIGEFWGKGAFQKIADIHTLATGKLQQCHLVLHYFSVSPCKRIILPQLRSDLQTRWWNSSPEKVHVRLDLRLFSENANINEFRMSKWPKWWENSCVKVLKSSDPPEPCPRGLSDSRWHFGFRKKKSSYYK